MEWYCRLCYQHCRRITAASYLCLLLLPLLQLCDNHFSAATFALFAFTSVRDVEHAAQSFGLYLQDCAAVSCRCQLCEVMSRGVLVSVALWHVRAPADHLGQAQ